MDIRNFHIDTAKSSTRPKAIFAALLHRTVGDFIDQLLFAASVKEAFGHARLTVYFRPDRPYKKDIVSLAPQVDSVVTTMDGWPVDSFDAAFNPPISPPTAWESLWDNKPDLVLTPSMCRFQYFGNLPGLARFSVPDQEFWEERLKDRISPSWYAVIHYRDGTFSYSSPNKVRDLKAIDPNDVVDRIIEKGGQAVRIGHPEMAPLRAQGGYIDLASAPLLEQAAAVNRARFFFEISPSGAASFATAFGTPLMRCNANNLYATIKQGSGATMPQRVIDLSGEDVTLQAVKSGFFMNQKSPEFAGYELRQNSSEQILEGLDLIIRQTKGDFWRESSSTPDRVPRNDLQVPFHGNLSITVLV